MPTEVHSPVAATAAVPTILVLGFEVTGKTCFVKSLTNQRDALVMPTIGCAREHLELDGATYCVLDHGGQDCMRPHWKRYYAEAAGVVYVVDAETLGSRQLAEQKQSIAEVAAATSDKPLLLVYNRRPGTKSEPAEAERLLRELDLQRVVGERTSAAAEETTCVASERESAVRGFKCLVKMLERHAKRRRKK